MDPNYKPGLLAASIFQGSKKSSDVNPALSLLFSTKKPTSKASKKKKESQQKSHDTKSSVKNNEKGKKETVSTIYIQQKAAESDNSTVKKETETIQEDKDTNTSKKGKKRLLEDTTQGSAAPSSTTDSHSSPKKKKAKTSHDNNSNDEPFPFVHESLLKPKSKAPAGSKKAKKKQRAENRDAREEEEATSLHHKRKKREKTADKRTVFVGNCPLSSDKKTITKLFRDFGAIETVRFRCGPVSKLEVPKRAAVIKKEFHENASNFVCYVVYKEEESAQKALKMNGHMMDSLHLRVDIASNHRTHDLKKSVFVGNLPFNVSEESLRRHFEDCGTVVNVRIVRDRMTSIGKGIAFVQFETSDGVLLAKKLNDSEFQGRNIRVKTCTDKPKPLKKVDDKPGNSKRPGAVSSKTPPPKKEKKLIGFAPSNRKSTKGGGGNKSFGEMLKEKKDKRKAKRRKQRSLVGAGKSDGLSSIFGDMSADLKKLKMDNPKYRDKKTTTDKKERKKRMKEKEKKKSKKLQRSE